MTRDSQIGKVYTAARVAGTQLPTLTPDEISEQVVKIMNSAWFQKRWPAPSLVKQVTLRTMQTTTYCTPLVTALPKRANAKRTPHEVEFRLAPGEVTLVQVLHLCTHLIRPNWLHDAEFCKEYLTVIGRFMDVDAKRTMTEIFRAHKVKHRVYSDEARAAASARMIARQSVPDLLALRDELAP